MAAISDRKDLEHSIIEGPVHSSGSNSFPKSYGLCSHKLMCGSPDPPASQNMTLFRATVIEVKWGHWGGPNPIWLVLLSEGEMKTQTHTDGQPCEGTSRKQPSISQGASGETAHTLISNFQPPRLRENKVLLSPLSLCGILLWPPKLTNTLRISNPFWRLLKVYGFYFQYC